MARRFGAMWGQANAFLFAPRRRRAGIDIAILVAGCGIIFGLVQVGREWTGHPPARDPARPVAPGAAAATPSSRWCAGWSPTCCRFVFTLVYALLGGQGPARRDACWCRCSTSCRASPCSASCPAWCWRWWRSSRAATSASSSRPIVMIFTGQAWNMTFSLYHSLKSVPAELQEAATALPLRLVAALPPGRAAVRRPRPRLEQHDEHGGRLVLPDDQRELRARRPRLPPARPRLLHERGGRAGRTCAAMVCGGGGDGRDDRARSTRCCGGR